MEEAVVTQVWMLEVVALMVVYSVAVFIGIKKRNKREAGQ